MTTLPVLTPSTMLSACPGDEVVIKCVESETTTRISLRWIITPINVMIHKIDLSLSNLMNNTNRLDARLQFYAELTSYYPLSSILTATAHPALDGATVTCITLTSRDSLIIRVAQIGNNNIPNLSCSLLFL